MFASGRIPFVCACLLRALPPMFVGLYGLFAWMMTGTLPMSRRWRFDVQQSWLRRLNLDLGPCRSSTACRPRQRKS
jgi:hypothetical protein